LPVSDDLANKRRAAEHHLQRLRQQLAEVERPWLRTRALRILVVFLTVSVVLSATWTIVITGMFEVDPLMGAHADILCPRICDGCTGPYSRKVSDANPHIHTRTTTSEIFCTAPTGVRREVPGGLGFIGVTMLPGAAPIALIIVAFLAVAGRKSYLARRNARRRAVDKAENDLAALT
jgi:hypothetical protein